MQILEVNEITEQLMESITRLLPQLADQPIPDKEAIAEIVASPNTILITASCQDTIVGMVTLVLYCSPSSLRARIEDVVVDESSRGKGIAKAMVRYAIDTAAKKKAIHIDLTSRPMRKAANRLYEYLGFTKYETNTYRYPL